MTRQNKRLIGIVSTVAVLLLIPLVAMLFTDEVNWNVKDFVVAGGLLLSVGLGIELIIRKVTKTSHRIAILAAVVIVFLLLWAELAVGIFGTPLAGS